jgi:SAM-dependent methyltransferase
MNKGDHFYKIYDNCKLEQYAEGTLHPGGLELTRKAFSLTRLGEGAKILDIGCGIGATVNYLSEEFGYMVIGVDSSAEMISKCRSKYAGLQFITGSADNLPVHSTEVDAVLMECSFSLIRDSEFALTECYRVLKEEGIIIISDIYYRKRLGKWTKDYFLDLMTEHGFILDVWEDCSVYLGQLAATSIMNQGEACLLWDCLLSKEENRGLTVEQIKGFKPGYFLMIAHKHKGNEGSVQEHDHDGCSGNCGKGD